MEAVFEKRKAPLDMLKLQGARASVEAGSLSGRNGADYLHFDSLVKPKYYRPSYSGLGTPEA
jgi:hypothetical protein